MGYGRDEDDGDYFADLYEKERRERQSEDMISGMQKRYYEASRAEVGATIECACCSRRIIKTTYHKRFCSNGKTAKGRNSCKDRYWNTVDDTRRERAKQYS